MGAAIAPGPLKPRPIDEKAQTLSALTARPGDSPGAGRQTAENDASLDPKARLDLIGRSLDRLEGGQMSALAAIDRLATRASSRDSAVLAATGLDPARLTATAPAAGVGGPYIPAEVDLNAPAFDRALAAVERDVGAAARLKSLMPFMPVRKPLAGEASVTSPFGYRPDPFLGRLALHPGVDLVQGYGADIRSTGAGRVIHAGPMGGYGTMVEIDHGAGLTTRYGHMSELLVQEGQEVGQGALIGRVGSSGRSTGPHLHYEVRVDGEPVDPERFLRAGAQLSAAE